MFRFASLGYTVMVVLAGFAFWPLYLSRIAGDVDPYTHFHAAVAITWCALLIVQPLLIPGRKSLHRAIGALSYVLAPLFLVASILLAHSRFSAMDHAKFLMEAPSLFLPLSACLLFGVSYVLAVAHRRTVALHARFMIATGLPMIDPVLGRAIHFYGPSLSHPLFNQAITFGLTDLILVALIVRPSLVPRLRMSYLAPMSLFPALHLAWFSVAQGPLWLPLASAFRALPLP